jgi:5-formyltetrahydrofolate cyclo-ligase
MDDKPVLRSRLKAARARRDQAELDHVGELIADVGMSCADGAEAVALYAAVGTEPPTRPLLDRLIASGRTVLLPMVTPTGLAWSDYDGWDALADHHGLLEPTGELVLRLDHADLVLVPALAVDRTGNRLGRGGGHYDRALDGIARDGIVAVVFSDEVLDVVPTEAHDIPVSAALTPEGLVPLSA